MPLTFIPGIAIRAMVGNAIPLKVINNGVSFKLSSKDVLTNPFPIFISVSIQCCVVALHNISPTTLSLFSCNSILADQAYM